jgi:hypothetical protein
MKNQGTTQTEFNTLTETISTGPQYQSYNTHPFATKQYSNKLSTSHLNFQQSLSEDCARMLQHAF